MKKLLLAAMLPAALGLAAPVSARTFYYPGTVCQPTAGAGTCIDFDQYGAHNNCSTAVSVECALPITTSGSPSVWQMYYTGYDRSTTANVNCQLQKTTAEGNVTYSTNVNTSNGGLNSGAQFPIAFPNVPADGFWRLRCSIPGLNAGQASHVTNLLLSTSE